MTLFENNADGLDRRDTANGDLFADKDEVTGIFDSILYVGKSFRPTSLCSVDLFEPTSRVNMEIIGVSIEPHREKTCHLGFIPGPTQTGLCNSRRL